MDTKAKILKLLDKPLTGEQIYRKLGITRATFHWNVRRMLLEGLVQKTTVESEATYYLKTMNRKKLESFLGEELFKKGLKTGIIQKYDGKPKKAWKKA